MKPCWQIYPGTYIDGRGTENVIFYNDGETLEVNIRGVVFSGKDFDGLEPSSEMDVGQERLFTLNRGELCDCTLTIDIPQVIYCVNSSPNRYLATLHVVLHLGKPARNGGIDREELSLAVSFDKWSYSTKAVHGLFETALLDLNKQLSPDYYFMNCFGCDYSDYFYGGQGLFGSMLCFQNCRSEYFAVKTKRDYINMFGMNSGPVQETHVCPHFSRRESNRGYRG